MQKRAASIYDLLKGNAVTHDVLGRIGAMMHRETFEFGVDGDFVPADVDANGYIDFRNGLSFKPNTRNNVRFYVIEEQPYCFSIILWCGVAMLALKDKAGHVVIRVDKVQRYNVPLIVEIVYDWFLINFESDVVPHDPDQYLAPSRRPDPNQPPIELPADRFTGWLAQNELFF